MAKPNIGDVSLALHQGSVTARCGNGHIIASEAAAVWVGSYLQRR